MSVDTFGVRKLFPTKTGGRTWYSTKWNNGQKRTILKSNFDPFDSKLQFGGGTPAPQLYINGKGIAEITVGSDSVRMFVHGIWLNTEATIYVRNDGQMDDVIIYSRSNHEASPYRLTSGTCGFGGYVFEWLDNDMGDPELKAHVHVEPLHPIYHRYLAQVPFDGIPKNDFIGFKQITRTDADENVVKVEGYINYYEKHQKFSNWTKLTEFTFDGTNVSIDPGAYESIRAACVGKGDLQAADLEAATLWLTQGALTWFRCNNAYNVKFKWMSVREIDPIS